MEYEQVKEWLDNLVRIHKEANEMNYLTSFIRASVCSGDVLIYQGIEEIADIMGLDISEKEINNSELKYRYSFEYDGVSFADFKVERLERFAGADRE